MHTTELRDPILLVLEQKTKPYRTQQGRFHLISP